MVAQELEKVFRERLGNSAGPVMKSYLEECSKGVESFFADEENELKSSSENNLD